MFTCVLGRKVASTVPTLRASLSGTFPDVVNSAWSLISTQTFRSALTASVNSCAEIKRAPSVA